MFFHLMYCANFRDLDNNNDNNDDRPKSATAIMLALELRLARAFIAFTGNFIDQVIHCIALSK